MTSNSERYKCPCGGTYEFDIKTQMLKCPFCDSVISQEEYDAMAAKKLAEDNIDVKDGGSRLDIDPETGEAFQEGQQETYICKSCGGAITPALTSISEKCPFCDSPIVLSGKISGEAQPDVIIPFKFDNRQVQEAYTKHVTSKHFVPKSFNAEARKKEIQGIYVPFWLLSCKADGEVNLDCQKITTTRQANQEITTHEHYDVYRKSHMEFTDLPADASKDMDDDLMDSIEPFNTAEALAFKTAYVSGFAATKYDVGVEESYPRFEKRMKESFVKAVIDKSVKGYDKVDVVNSQIDFSDRSIKYAMFPVWIIRNQWNGKDFIFAVNGQTGKLVGNLPTDWSRMFTSAGIWSVPAAAVCIPLAKFLMENAEWSGASIIGFLVALVLSLIVHFAMVAGNTSVADATQADGYLDQESFSNAVERDKYSRTERQVRTISTSVK